MSMPNVAICGKARTGKDATAAILIELYGYRRLGFADKLKAIADELLRLDSKNEALKAKYRWVYQDVGQFFRALHEKIHGNKDVWIDFALNKIKLDRDAGDDRPVIVTDCRFQNEVYKLRAAGFKIVRLEIPRDIRESRGQLGNEEDISETDLDNKEHLFDYVYRYDGATPEQVANRILEELNIKVTND